MNLRASFAVLFVLPLWAQPAPTDHVAQATAKVREVLRGLPNYTCTMTIERSQRTGGRKKFEPLEPVRVEVAYIDHDEFYAWPGSSKFHRGGLASMIGGRGAIGSGDFGLHLSATYFGSVPLEFVGVEALRGTPALKFTQSVPRALSNYEVMVPPKTVVAGYDVVAWHDPATHALMRYEMSTTDLPKPLGIRRSFKAVEYQDVAVAGKSFRLPLRTELWMTAFSGLELRTVHTFSDCHEYLGESKLLFLTDEEEAAAKNAPAAEPPLTALPPKTKIETQWPDGIDFSRLARGDVVSLPVVREVKSGGKTLVPVGAKLLARVANAQCTEDPFLMCYAIFVASELSLGGRTIALRTALISPSRMEQINAAATKFGAARSGVFDRFYQVDDNGAVIILILKRTPPRDRTLTWRTLEVRGESAP